MVGSFSAFTIVELALPGLLGALAVLAPRRRARQLLGLAAVALLVAVAPPAQSWAAGSVTGHMVQHVVLVVVASPLAALGLAASAHWFPPRLRRALRAPITLVLAALGHVVALAVWHLPGPYDAALGAGWVHALDHGLLFGTALVWWGCVANHLPRRDPFLAALSLFAVATASAVIGILQMFATPLYAHGDLADQQLAGAVMAGTGAVYGASGLVLVARAVARLERPRRSRTDGTRLDRTRPVTGIVALAGLGAATVIAVSTSLRPAEGAAPAPTPPPTVTTPSAAPRSEGELLYLRDCASCHGPAGEGSFRGIAITDVGPASVRYTLSTGRMPIDSPDAPVRRSTPRYAPTEIDALVAHVSTFVDGPDLPTLDRSAGIARGGELYRLHCAACHGATGDGGAQAFGREAPSVLHAAPEEVAAAIVAGPGGMPSFVATLDDAEIAAVAEYVDLLQDPPTRGLAIPGGRVGEGLVAWLFGIGLIALIVTWMGRRS